MKELGTFEIEVDEFDLFKSVHDVSLLSDKLISNVVDIKFDEKLTKWIIIGIIVLEN